MFYLSSGILNNLYKRINLRKGAIELPYKCEIFPKMQKYKQENPMIVKVVDIIFFEHEKVLGMELFDEEFLLVITQSCLIKINGIS